MKTSSQFSQTPLTDLMLHPEKIDAVLSETKGRKDNFAAEQTDGRISVNPAKQHAPPKDNGSRKLLSRSRLLLKKIAFQLKAPSAGSVKLAADFTDWEKSPLNMAKSDDGVWSILVPLSPGNYSYRFIADGKWCDDPHAGFYEPNPFGSANAVVKVA
jgi:hypothetical protein